MDRIMAAASLEPVDRTPIVPSANAVNAAVTGLPLATYCQDMEANCTANIEAFHLMGETLDAFQFNLFQPDALPTCWLSETRVPGRELPENELWQVHEAEVVKPEDYDEILEIGFGPWYQKFLVERLGDPMTKCQSYFEYLPIAAQRFVQAEIPFIVGGSFYTPFEMFCGGRSMMEFFTNDLYFLKDKVDAVFHKVQEFNMAMFEQQLNNPAGKPFSVWIGGWRGTPGMVSKEIFERYSWQYMKEIADLVISHGVVPVFHLDSDWGQGLHYFNELEPKKAIMALDGKTDIRRAKEVVGDRMCIMGDVHAEMFSFGKPEDVTAYCKSLIKDIGPKGFILSSGCDVPFNAKLENIQAMAKSVL